MSDQNDKDTFKLPEQDRQKDDSEKLAADLIRQKLDAIYGGGKKSRLPEPAVEKEEVREEASEMAPDSNHESEKEEAEDYRVNKYSILLDDLYHKRNRFSDKDKAKPSKQIGKDSSRIFSLPDIDDQEGVDASSKKNKSTKTPKNSKEESDLYQTAPDITEPVKQNGKPSIEQKNLSKHQRFMANLVASGLSFEETQKAWNDYYLNLPNNEKNEVWNEFYKSQGATTSFAALQKSNQISSDYSKKDTSSGQKTIADIRRQIVSKVDTRSKLTSKQHLQSIMFGLSTGLITVVILLFGFFNERVIAPFITPSRNVSATPLIADGVSGSVGSDPRLIIPKINVELPVVYDVETVEEKAVQEGLERGVVHYATTSNPGEKGNGAIFGHSSNNILNKGKYKFAFVLLSKLEDNDTFYIEKDGIRYVYKVFQKEIVKPSQVDVLYDVPGKESTMALITCDPPGTTLNRLVVWGEQVSPDPIDNIASTEKDVQINEQKPEILAGNPESLWSRIIHSIF